MTSTTQNSGACKLPLRATSKAPIGFRGFDERGDVRIYYHGALPHWRQSGCTYFVTFRLGDSIPRPVLQQLEHERTLWLSARSIDVQNDSWPSQFAKLPLKDRQLYAQLVGRLIEKSLDECHGCCALQDPSASNQVAKSLDHFHGQRVLTGDFVVMPNHVHVLMTPINGHELEDILHAIKSYTANQINRVLKRKGSLWQRESYDHIVRDTEQLEAYQRYIAANPSKAKLRAGQYVHSAAEYRLASS